MSRRVIVTGSRHWEDRQAIVKALADLPAGSVVVQGGALGADQIAITAALERGDLQVETHPAEWKKLGKAAGPIRNQEMVDAGADVVYAFPLPSSVGTFDLMRRAEAAGIPIRDFFAEKLARLL